MKKLFIADCSEVFLEMMRQQLESEYEVITCSSGDAAVDLICTQEPDILITNVLLPHVDGLTLLSKIRRSVSPLIIVTATSFTDYIVQAGRDLGADYFITLPCSPETIRLHIEKLLEYRQRQSDQMDPQSIVSRHLQRLGLNPAMDGTKQLRVGIPLFAQDQNQRLAKELYPIIASLCRNGSVDQVEHSIRDAIHQAWQNRDEEVWRCYFPHPKGTVPKCPNNKLFIARIALELLKSLNETITQFVL